MDWATTQGEIQGCRLCEVQLIPSLRVPCGQKRKPPWEPVRPVRLYFVSVAPPWGGDYFWDETKADDVRDGLFKSLQSLPEPLDSVIDTCQQFRDARLFLTPAVKCPSSSDNMDALPSPPAVTNCARFLRAELIAAGADRILALGRVPFRALCQVFGLHAPSRVAEFRKQVAWVPLGAKRVPLMGTYFPGNNRHRGFPSIAEDIGRLLTLAPKSTDV